MSKTPRLASSMFGGSPFPFFFFFCPFCPHSVHGELGDKAEEQFELTLKFWGECNTSGDVQLVVLPSAARTGWCNMLGNLGSPQHHSCLGDAWTLAPEQGAEQPLSMFPWGRWFGRGAAEPLPQCFGSLRGFTPSGDGSRLLTLPPLPSCSFWFLKFLVLVGLTVGAFYIPDGSFTSGEGAAGGQWGGHRVCSTPGAPSCPLCPCVLALGAAPMHPALSHSHG